MKVWAGSVSSEASLWLVDGRLPSVSSCSLLSVSVLIYTV